VKGGQQFAKAYGIKMRCYGEYVGEYIGNLGNILGTHWEREKNEKKILLAPSKALGEHLIAI
jgi:hypothetical protein